MKFGFKKNSALICWFAFLLILLLMTSCRSKKKITDRSSENVKRELVSSVSDIENKDVETKTTTIVSKDSYIISKNDVIELTQADSSKSITITDASGKTVSIKGANVVFKNEEHTTKSKDSISEEKTISDKSKSSSSENIKLDESIDKNKRSTDVDVKSTSTWLWIWLIIALLLYFVYRFRAKLF